MRSTAIADRLRGKLLAALIVAFAAGALAPGAAVAGTLDQQQTDSGGGPFAIESTESLAQTFTAGLSGGLDRVDLYLDKIGGPTDPLNVEIRDVVGGAPGNAVLASFSVSPGSVPSFFAEFVSIPFAAPAPVTAGIQYAMVAHSVTDSANRYRWWWSSSTNPYASGAILATNQSPPVDGWNGIVQDVDLAFRTYVVPKTVPSNARCSRRTATLTGTAGDDELTGTPGPDVILGFGGNDRIRGLGGRDVICGGDGKDTLIGGKGNDKLLGQGGRDKLKGGKGRDKLFGGRGKDKLLGGKGRDKLRGGKGGDICKGGKGRDSAKKCKVEKSI